VEGHVTEKTAFTPEQWSLLVRLPRWVAAAASASQPDGPLRTAAEREAGMVTIAHARGSGNAFVEGLARQLIDEFDDPDPGVIDFRNKEAGITRVLERAQAANQLLTAVADGADAAAYRNWLLGVTDVVIRAARTGDVLGIGGVLVTQLEWRFRDQLVEVFREAGERNPG
jgi:hypothetical protein